VFSVFYHMSEFITNVVFELLSRYVLGERPAFEEKFGLTVQIPEHGWVPSAIGNQVMAEYRAKNFHFMPRFTILHETDTVRGMKFIREQRPHERVYVSWRDVASEDFFKNVESLFRMAQKRSVEGATKKRGG